MEQKEDSTRKKENKETGRKNNGLAMPRLGKLGGASFPSFPNAISLPSLNYSLGLRATPLLSAAERLIRAPTSIIINGATEGCSFVS